MYVLAQIRERGLKLNVPGERLINRAHERIFDVVADSCQVAEANQLAPTELIAVAADDCILWMAVRQPHFVPNLQGGSIKAVAPLNIAFIRAAVVEEVEFDQFHALVLEIEQRTVDATAIGT